MGILRGNFFADVFEKSQHNLTQSPTAHCSALFRNYSRATKQNTIGIVVIGTECLLKNILENI